MIYIPNTDADRREMLATLGIDSVSDLFGDVPAAHRFPELGCRRHCRNGSAG